MLGLGQSTIYALVVDTEQYAGNFERAMCAYATGVVGGCTRGEKEASLFAEQEPDSFDRDIEESVFWELMVQEMDEDGCARPVTIVATPGWFNDGDGREFRDEGQEIEGVTKWPSYQSVGMFFERRLTSDEEALVKRRVAAFAELNNITVTGYRWLEKTEIVREMKEGEPKQCLMEGVDDYPDDEHEMRESEKEGEGFAPDENLYDDAERDHGYPKD